MKKVLFTVTVLLLVAAFGISAFLVGSYVLNGKKQEEKFDNLSEIVANAEAENVDPEDPEATHPRIELRDENGILKSYKEIHEMNPDTVGWLKMEGTEIDYPVMQTPNDPGFYLYRDFDKGNSDRGCIFAWEAADVTEPSDNITLFGHNMRDGSMFASLNAYTDKSAWETNSLIFFDTLTEYHTYKIFAVFKTEASVDKGFKYHQFVDAADEEEFDEFVSTCKELSFYDTGITPVYGDKLLCLSTCEYTLENGRLVVAAVRIT
ncbi:MAG: class B sortase [Oscillospiraceae bacterium]|nr:class B sortase [Oscillospiraceae bacterium]MBQ7130777.1 class B sortase [Oscillospiraceae bacterium]